MVSFDKSYSKELTEKIDYELWALEFYLNYLFNDQKYDEPTVTITLSKKGGVEKKEVNHQFSFVADLGRLRIRKELAKLSPLAFMTAFKAQDMIAEWILAINGFKGWRFSEKKKYYDKLCAAKTFKEPQLFQNFPIISEAFWKLYRNMECLRSTFVHNHSFSVNDDGTLDIIDRNKHQTILTPSMQYAYIRFISLCAKLLGNETDHYSYYCSLVENCLYELASLHNIPLPIRRRIIHKYVMLNLNDEYVDSLKPYAAKINLDNIYSDIKKSHKLGCDDKVFITLRICSEAEGRRLIWKLPPEKIQPGILDLREDDVEYKQYLTIENKSKKS